jgi:hypothetical protein
MFFGTVVIGATHGLILLPVVLSFIGKFYPKIIYLISTRCIGPSRKNKIENGNRKRTVIQVNVD